MGKSKKIMADMEKGINMKMGSNNQAYILRWFLKRYKGIRKALKQVSILKIASECGAFMIK
jgi:hypothetical protein